MQSGPGSRFGRSRGDCGCVSLVFLFHTFQIPEVSSCLFVQCLLYPVLAAAGCSLRGKDVRPRAFPGLMMSLDRSGGSSQGRASPPACAPAAPLDVTAGGRGSAVRLCSAGPGLTAPSPSGSVGNYCARCVIVQVVPACPPQTLTSFFISSLFLRTLSLTGRFPASRGGRGTRGHRSCHADGTSRAVALGRLGPAGPVPGGRAARAPWRVPSGQP